MWESPRGVRLPVAMLRPAVLLLLLLTRGMEAFRVCAFNTQRLTLVKVAQVEVMDTLVRVCSLLQGSWALGGRQTWVTRSRMQSRGDSSNVGADVQVTLLSRHWPQSPLLRNGWGVGGDGMQAFPRSFLVPLCFLGCGW